MSFGVKSFLSYRGFRVFGCETALVVGLFLDERKSINSF